MKRREELNESEERLTELDLCTFCYPSEEYDITPEILHVFDDTYVLPALGNMIPGYVLLIHQEHVDCYGALSEDEISDCKREKEIVADILREEFGACCMFEHGRVGACMKRNDSKICFHAHVHCLPVSDDLIEHVSDRYTHHEAEDWTQLSELYDEFGHYLYVEEDSGDKAYFEVGDEPVERQYLKQVACEAADIDGKYANWQEYPRWDNIDRTLTRLRPRFENL